MKYILGADPGKTGAIALINANADLSCIGPSDVILFPTKVDGGKVNTALIMQNLRPYAKDIVMAVQESVHAIFGSSAKGSFEFGDANGALRTAIEASLFFADNEQEVHVVPPKTWQKVSWAGHDVVASPVLDKQTKQAKTLKSGAIRMQVDTKATSMKVAHSRFPGVSFVMPRCKNESDGCIDAALIAFYALTKYRR